MQYLPIIRVILAMLVVGILLTIVLRVMGFTGKKVAAPPNYTEQIDNYNHTPAR